MVVNKVGHAFNGMAIRGNNRASWITRFMYFVTEFKTSYADAKQSALEIRTSFLFLFFFFSFMVVANCNASCYWLHVNCSQW